MDKLFVTTVGIGLIWFIWWFFFGKKEEESYIGNDVEIVVEGGYKPAVVKLKKDEKANLTFIRKDPSSCLEEVIISDFKVKKYLPLNEKVKIELTPRESGAFEMHCGMNMFHGKVVVE